MKEADFNKIQMYECVWCGKVFKSMWHKCKFNPKLKNCFSCKYCTGFEEFEGQEADPQTGWQWEIPPYRFFKCDLEEANEEDYPDFDALYSRGWKGNCPYWEQRKDYKGRESYAEIFATKI